MTDVIERFKDVIASGVGKQAREDEGWTQTELAKLMGISAAAISRWEAGSRIPSEELATEYLQTLSLIELQDSDGDTDDDCPDDHHKMPDGTCMPDSEMDDDRADGVVYGFSGVAVVEGTWTGDGRQFATGSLTWPDLAETVVPLQWQKESSHGGDHDVTVNVGRITSAERVDDYIAVEGSIDAESDDGAEVIRRLKAGTLSGVSIVADDPDNGDVEISFDSNGEPEGVIFHSGRIRALTLVDIPAFVEGKIELTAITAAAETIALVSEAAWDGSASRFSDEQWRMATAYCDTSRGETAKEQCGLPHHEPGGAVSRAGVHAAAARVNQVDASAEAISRAKAHLRGHYVNDLHEEVPDVLTASADPDLERLSTMIAAAHAIHLDDLPPKEWFDEPKDLPEVGAITVTDEGRLYGLLAPRNVAHRAFRDSRVTVPMGNVDYSRWMSRQTITAEGERIATGAITMECGHASVHNVSGQAAAEHYENSCSVVATARVGENAHGVWIAGALMADVTPAQVARIMACQLSGDWRPHREQPGLRELAGALLVPVPGFPVGDNTASMRIEDGQLVASAAPVTWVADAALAAGAIDIEEGDDDDVVPDSGDSDDTADDSSAAEEALIEDLPAYDEVVERKNNEARARIRAMAAELGLRNKE